VGQEKSGLYYPNKIANIYLQAVEEMIGPEAMGAVLNLANLPDLIDNYPPANMAREFDFSDFGAIGAALEKMYGPRGERGLGLHAGKASFTDGLKEFGSKELTDLAFKTIPLKIKLKIGIRAMAETFKSFSDQLTTVAETDDLFIYTIHRCPVCWGRVSAKPICYAAVGIIQAGLSWISGGREFEVEEVACTAVGDESCIFHIHKGDGL
jgi:predicted hydrocarbon binding protein